jgi:UDP-N-acetylmuramate--alanine ligase
MSVQGKKVHFIGVGGIGVSALARYYASEGWLVFGSDLAESEITEGLKNIGLEFFSGTADLAAIKPDLVVFSPAVPETDFELKQARAMGIKCLSYPQALGELTKKYFTIAVCGTHGKSTTTSMLGLLLSRAGLDPTVIVGTKLKEFGDTNFLPGKSKYLVIEACEHLGSFLNYWPKITVITNIEADHLDYYKTEENVRRAFFEFAGHLGKDGILIANGDDKNTTDLIGQLDKNGFKIVKYGLSQPEAEVLASTLSVPGKHNISNALSALAVARELGIADETSFKALSEYHGSWRRFQIDEIKVDSKNVLLLSDYGHHPTEIRATLEAVRQKWPKKTIKVIFQPHQFQRTYYLFDDFARVFREAPVDRLAVTDVYGVAGREAGETNYEAIAGKLAKAAAKDSVFYLPRAKAESWIRENIGEGEVLVIMGAGDVYDLSKLLISSNKNV